MSRLRGVLIVVAAMVLGGVVVWEVMPRLNPQGGLGMCEPQCVGVLGAPGDAVPGNGDLALLKELTEDGIENGTFGLQGLLTSELRVAEGFPQEYSFDDVREWVDQNMQWDVVGLDRTRSYGDVAVMSVRAAGQGQLGREFEQAVVVAEFVVIYGVGGEFPGLFDYYIDAAPFVVWGILSNEYDWRKVKCEGLRC